MSISFFYNPTDDSHRVMNSTIYRLCERYSKSIMNVICVKDLRHDICVSKVSNEYQIIPSTFYNIKQHNNVKRLLTYQTSHNVGKWCGTTSHIDGIVSCESNTLFDMLCDIIDGEYQCTNTYQFSILDNSVTIIDLHHHIHASVSTYDTNFILHFSTSVDLCRYIQKKIDHQEHITNSLYRQLGIHQEHIETLKNIKDNFGEEINK